MINILKTEYSFRKCFMHMKDVHKYVIDGQLAIADLDNTFGHIPFSKEAKKHGFKPIYGVRLRVSRPENEKKRTGQVYTTFIAKNDEGLKEIYKLTSKAYDNFHYFPRLYQRDIANLKNVIILEDVYENFFPTTRDRQVYELLAGAERRGNGYVYKFDQKVGPMHIVPIDVDLSECSAKLPQAKMVKWGKEFNFREVCLKQAKNRGISLPPEYMERFEYEINLIIGKDYPDYFMIVADMINYAKKHMLVGPSRGSSAGSLVCYMLGITEVDPMAHDLIFERFIDINRFDLPDIDVDFPDSKRAKVFDYLVKKYGRNKVRNLANINRLMPKSAIGEFAQGLGIPKYETESVKNAILDRSSGDARAAMCIVDTFETTEPGKEFISKYPAMKLVSDIEGHASHVGKHAAGILVSTEDLTTYGSINSRDDVIMMDKKDAESIGLLKIDCLGLRTLSVLEDTIEQIPGMKFKDIYSLPLDDEKTIQLFNTGRFIGIFQFEGQALQFLTKKMGIYNFNDIAAMTALARPGPMHSGGANIYVTRRTGDKPIEYISQNPIFIKHVKDTLGVIIYQEQLMSIARELGDMTWAEVSDLRRAASKSLGEEFFNKYRDSFLSGTRAKNMPDEEAIKIWENMVTFGSWGFNKSHAISYGLISYWTAYFKAHYPLEYAVAALNNAKDEEQTIHLLRDLVTNEGMQYLPVLPEKSMLKWSVIDGKLVGGLTNIKGIGDKKAQLFIDIRNGKAKPTPSFWKMMENPETPYDIIFPSQHYYGHIYNDPRSSGLMQPPTWISRIEQPGEYTIVGKVKMRDLRDLNDYNEIVKRGGEIYEENNLYLRLLVEDDTGQILCTINRFRFSSMMGKHLSEVIKEDKTWIMCTGTKRGDWNKLDLTELRILNEH